MKNKEHKVSVLRLFFRTEKGRRGVSRTIGIIISLISALVLWSNRDILQKDDSGILSDALQMASIMAALLSGIAYNLRIQSVEYYVKSLNLGTPTHNPIETARALTNLTILSFVSSMLLLLTSCISTTWYLGIVVIASGSAGVLASCSVQYIYTIFAQEKLEEEYIIKEQQAFVRALEKGERHIPTDL